MRNVLIAIVAIVVLAAGGLGGTFATWSDSETSANNTIITGSLDLKVNGDDDKPWGDGIAKVTDIDCMVPGLWYYGGNVTLWNAGTCTQAADAWMHLKEYKCTNVEPKAGGIEDENLPLPTTPFRDPPESLLKPEPELVAEYGGKVDCIWVDGIGGPEGDDCSMGSHIKMAVMNTMVPPGPGSDPIRIDFLEPGKWYCDQFYLFDLIPCNERTIHFYFTLLQDNEWDDWTLNYIPDPGQPGFDQHTYDLFDDWPSHALMSDKVTFVIEYGITLADID
jgi:predicted ribosomally synthesized peptide with SipW-like signal peptide